MLEIRSAESYTRVKKHYTDKRDEVLAKLVIIEQRDRDLVKHAEFGFPLISDLPGYWTAAPPDVKRDLVGLMFGGKLVFEKSELRIPELHPIFELFDAKMGQNRQDRSPERATDPEWYRKRVSISNHLIEGLRSLYVLSDRIPVFLLGDQITPLGSVMDVRGGMGGTRSPSLNPLKTDR